MNFSILALILFFGGSHGFILRARRPLAGASFVRGIEMTYARTVESAGKQQYRLASDSNSNNKNNKEPEKEGLERLMDILNKEEAKDPKKKSGPPIYTPGNYGQHVLAALAYAIPIVDASDLGKYMFEAYPVTAEVYNGIFGAPAAIYNGVPFLPFAVFFLMSYICRAPNFPTEVRFHFAQAFMLSIIQFVPSLGLGLLEKGGVPGLGVIYNTVFLWVMLSALFMQVSLLNPISSAKNPVLINVVGWAMRYMNYTKDMTPSK